MLDAKMPPPPPRFFGGRTESGQQPCAPNSIFSRTSLQGSTFLAEVFHLLQHMSSNGSRDS